MPIWANDRKFVLAAERRLQTELIATERRVQEAQKDKERVAEELRDAGAYRGLLYEKGKVLEAVVIDALRLLGFKAERFRESSSEFDVVFESEEERLIGEVEGKDGKPVNIDKLRQLALNVHEDLQRESVTAPAKAVLFGNGFRLRPMEERGEPFTDKCNKAAASSGVALVFTPDLFRPVQYLTETTDMNYAQKCRLALAGAVGRVIFPSPPETESSNGNMETQVVAPSDADKQSADSIVAAAGATAV